MGDPQMVALFWVALLPSTIRWQQHGGRGRSGIRTIADILGRVKRLDLSLSQYADDTTKQIVARAG